MPECQKLRTLSICANRKSIHLRNIFAGIFYIIIEAWMLYVVTPINSRGKGVSYEAGSRDCQWHWLLQYVPVILGLIINCGVSCGQ